MFKLDCLAVEFINYLLNRGGFQFKFSIYRYRIWCALDVISLSTSAGALCTGSCISLNLSLNKTKTALMFWKIHIWINEYCTDRLNDSLSGMTRASIRRGTYYTSFKPYFMCCRPNFQTYFSLWFMWCRSYFTVTLLRSISFVLSSAMHFSKIFLKTVFSSNVEWMQYSNTILKLQTAVLLHFFQLLTA